jgi:subtilisin family serine protease
MKKTFTFILLALFCACGYAQTIDPVLQQEMEQRSDDEKIDVIVILKSQYDRQQLNRRAAHFATRAERREFVVNELKQFAEVSQYDLRHSLSEMERQDMTTAPKIIWMANALYFSATKQAINDLALRRDIEIIGFDKEEYMLFDEEPKPALMTRGITHNVSQVNADQVWNLGYTGQGVVVAVIDSGVNYNHLDLADHLWDGGDEYPNHGYDFVYDGDNDPMDDYGHGTHCAGILCGDGTAGQQTGIAPDATLMCVKVLNATGNGTTAKICNGMQWAVEQGCDLISMSVGGSNPTLSTRLLYRNTCEAVLDAGVIAAISAGNQGNDFVHFPLPNNVCVPGSCPPPYLDPVQKSNPGGLSCSLCVGSVGYTDHAAASTSRGPVTWADTDFGDYPLTEGHSVEFGLIRPDVCAPGVDVISADYLQESGYTTMSGTSMATPCVAGCISLMLSKNRDITPAEICQVLEETAVPLATGKSNVYGYGRVDALAAINALNFGSLKLESVAVDDGQGNNNGRLNPGETVSLDLTLMNDSDVALDGATMVISTESEYVTITDGTVTLPHFDAGQIMTIGDSFAFTLSDDAPRKRAVQFMAEIYIDGEPVGLVRIEVMVYGYVLRFDEVAVLNDNNGNDLLDAGETADLHVVISNIGNEPATSIVGALSTAFPYLTINDVTETFGEIEVDGQASVDFNVTLASTVSEDYIIDFILNLVDNNEMHTDLDFKLYGGIIDFADANVKAVCVSHWDTNGDGELSYAEAASVLSLGTCFKYNSEITSFDELQYFVGLSSIRNYAFDHCTGLTSVVLPNSVTIIEKSAFSNCSGLLSLTIPGSVTVIEDNAFAYCNNHIELNYLGDIAQWCNIQFEESLFGGANPLGHVDSFYLNNELVTDLVIPETVTEIKNYTFRSARCFTSLTIPNSVISIGSYAFSNCSSMTSVAIGNSVVSISDNAFSNCSSLTSLTLSNSITSIGESAFYDCSGLNAVYYTGNIEQWCSIQFANYSSNPLYCAHNFFIANELETDLVIPETVTEIKPYAFYGATCLTSLTIPYSVTTIGGYAFNYCSGLISITIGNSVTSIGSSAFYNCTNLTYITLGNSVTSIGSSAFNNCNSILSVTSFAETPPALGQNSFGSFNSNVVVFVPCDFEDAYDSLSWGGYSNFYGMCGGTVAVVANPVEGGTVTGGGTFEEGQTCIVMATAMEDYYFAKWTLNGMIVSYDSEYTFYAAGDMTLVAHFVPDGNIVFADSVVKSICVSHWDTNVDGELSYIEAALVTSLDQAFKGNTDITSFDELQYFIGLTSIGSYDFSQCSGLATIVMPNSVASIKSYAFYKCTGLTSLTIGNTVVSIGDCAFQNCSGMTGPLVIPDSVVLIGYSAFRDCSGLTSLVLGNSVTSIERFAFYGCSGMTGPLTLPNSLNSIDVSAFYGCSGFTGNLIIPNSVTSIGSSAFRGCSGFTGNLILPNSVTTINYNTFSGCSGFTGNLTIPSSVTSIGEWAFSSCRGISSLVIGNSVTSIGDYAFYSCDNINTMFVFAETPPTIGDNYVFGGVSRNIPVYVPCDAVEAYQNADKWNVFTNVKGMCSGEIAVIINPAEGGTVTGAGYYNGGDPCVLTATPNPGFSFGNWTEDGIVISRDPVLSFYAYPTTIVANFYSDRPIVFADANVKAICVANWDTNGDGELSYAEAAVVTSVGEIFSENSIITSFDEFQYFIGLNYIDGYSFYGCSGLTSIEIPGSVTYVGADAFSYCSGLTSITVWADNPPTLEPSWSGGEWDDDWGDEWKEWVVDDAVYFDGVDKSIPLYVPCHAGEAYQSADGWGEFTNIMELCDFRFITSGTWGNPDNWSGGVLPGVNDSVSIDANCSLYRSVIVGALNITDGNTLTLQKNGTLIVTRTLTNTSAEKLVIKDGAQLINASENVAATMEKDVSAYSSDNPDGWYTIASPMNGTVIAGSGFVTYGYDLYRYNETNLTGEEWENYKANHEDFITFENGRGYLYANGNAFSPSFTGTLNASTVTIPLTCTERPDDPLSGFNLIGNPFPHEIYKGAGAAIDNMNLASGYYTLTNEGTWQVHTFDDAIQPGQGILVKAITPTVLTISKNNEAAYSETGEAKAGRGVLCISAVGDSGQDRAFVYFGQGVDLDKVEDMAKEAMSLAIRKENRDYAIAYFDKKSDTMEVVFTAPDSGLVTLNVKANANDFEYLHLVDLSTGEDMDLLSAPEPVEGPNALGTDPAALRPFNKLRAQGPQGPQASYTFEAHAGDPVSRFTIVYEVR